jgi:spermidine/putrescine transport system ATP-binding protein
LHGTVVDASYIGVSTEYVVRTGDGHDITVYAQNLETSGASQSLSSGHAVTLSWRPDHAFVLVGAPGSHDDGSTPTEEAS